MHPRDSIFQLGVRAFAANNRPASISVTNRAHNKTLFFTVSVAEHERDGSTKERERKKESIERAFHGASKSALRTNLLNFTLARCGKNPPPLLRKFTWCVIEFLNPFGPRRDPGALSNLKNITSIIFRQIYDISYEILTTVRTKYFLCVLPRELCQFEFAEFCDLSFSFLFYKFLLLTAMLVKIYIKFRAGSVNFIRVGVGCIKVYHRQSVFLTFFWHCLFWKYLYIYVSPKVQKLKIQKFKSPTKGTKSPRRWIQESNNRRVEESKILRVQSPKSKNWKVQELNNQKVQEDESKSRGIQDFKSPKVQKPKVQKFMNRTIKESKKINPRIEQSKSWKIQESKSPKSESHTKSKNSTSLWIQELKKRRIRVKESNSQASRKSEKVNCCKSSLKSYIILNYINHPRYCWYNTRTHVLYWPLHSRKM